MEKPTYETSKKAIWLSMIMAWVVIAIIVVGAALGSRTIVNIAPIVVPSMVGLIVGLLGLHRGFGSLDMRTLARKARGEIVSEGAATIRRGVLMPAIATSQIIPKEAASP